MFSLFLRFSLKFVAVIIFSLSLGIVTAQAASPLVDVDWVKSNTGKDNIVFIDLRAAGSYQAGHVPGAINTSYGRDQWRMKLNGINGMRPPVAHVKKLVEKLGIKNNSHVVLMHGGYSAAETGIATRIYWTLKLIGLKEISILNGGMTAYLKDKTARLEKGRVAPVATTFNIKMNRSILATARDVEIGLKSDVQLLDSRPTDQHIGINKSGSVTRHGTLPNSISVPGRWMTVNDKGVFRSKSVLAKIYAAQKASSKRNTIVFCNTGHWASLGWFIDSELLGNKQSKMYDGSLAQWSRLPAADHPLMVKLNTQ